MKTLLTIFFSLLIFGGTAQTTRRVNNNTGISVSGTNVYSTFAAAHTAAAANDIIIIEPSSISYGDITITKPLKIYGNGYYLNSTQKADTRTSILGTVDFNTGSGGSEMYGMVANIVLIYGVSNITVSRNNINGAYLYTQNKANTTNTNVTNILINRNTMNPITASPTAGFTISNVLVNNNNMGNVGASSDPGIQSWVVRNNTFGSSTSSLALVNSVLENNFFVAGGTAPSLTNVTSSYNISTGSSFPAGIGNESNYDIVTDPPWLGSANDAAYQIKPGDPLKTKGSGGIEVGAYGGTTPYIVSGIPAIPSITSFVNTATGDATNPVKVTISVKSNN